MTKTGWVMSPMPGESSRRVFCEPQYKTMEFLDSLSLLMAGVREDIRSDECCTRNDSKIWKKPVPTSTKKLDRILCPLVISTWFHGLWKINEENKAIEILTLAPSWSFVLCVFLLCVLFFIRQLGITNIAVFGDYTTFNCVLFWISTIKIS